MDFNRVYQNLTMSPPYHSTTPSIQFYSVGSKQEAQNLQPQFNVKYIIINNIDREIYIKELNNNGLIDFITYKDVRILESNKSENDDTKLKDIEEKVEALSSNLINIENTINKISSSIFNIENNKIGNKNEYDRTINECFNAEPIIKTSNNASISANDEWKVSGAAKANNH